MRNAFGIAKVGVDQDDRQSPLAVAREEPALSDRSSDDASEGSHGRLGTFGAAGFGNPIGSLALQHQQ